MGGSKVLGKSAQKLGSSVLGSGEMCLGRYFDLMKRVGQKGAGTEVFLFLFLWRILMSY